MNKATTHLIRLYKLLILIILLYTFCAVNVYVCIKCICFFKIFNKNLYKMFLHTSLCSIPSSLKNNICKEICIYLLL